MSVTVLYMLTEGVGKMRNKQNWQTNRTVRGSLGNESNVGYISLEIENEDLGTLLQDEWASPITATLFGNLPPKNFDYSTGSVVYTGSKKARVEVNFIASITVGGVGNDASAEITNGVDGVQCLSGIMPASSAFGGAIPLDTVCHFEIEQGETLDGFIRQTSQASAQVIILKGVYHVKIIDILD